MTSERQSVAALVPAYQAESTIGSVVEALGRLWPCTGRGRVTVVDDGSLDGTAAAAREAGALVVCHGRNRGKGAALRTGMRVASTLGFRAVVTVDADGQHPAEQALVLADFPFRSPEIVLGVRDLLRDGAPRPNRVSNAISNYFLSKFIGQTLGDTQCGLRRYPLPETLNLDGRSDGYAYEAEVLLLAARARIALIEVPVRVIYDPTQRSTHFHRVRDPARIIARVLRTLAR